MKHVPIVSAVAAYFLATLPALADPTDVVAHVGDRSIRLEEVDEAGGRGLYDASHALYEQRVRSLYTLLSDELLAREAATRNLSVDALLEQEVSGKTAPVTDDDIDRYLAQQTGLDRSDPRLRKRVLLYLEMERQSNQKKAYLAALFKRHNVSIALATPPAPPTEEVLGPLSPDLGPETAPVTLIAFSDYKCPYCRELSKTLHALHAQYPSEVRIVHRNFPLQPDSQRLAEAAMCAQDQDRFWDYHDLIFSTAGVRGDQAIELAEQLSLDVARFSECLDSGQHARRVQDDYEEGQRLEITGTPTMFVNGIRIRGAATLGKLTAQIQEILLRQGTRSEAPATPTGG